MACGSMAYLLNYSPYGEAEFCQPRLGPRLVNIYFHMTVSELYIELYTEP
jgi:hypothetical protein